MTREEILAMPAGREMDALVAERVMGWELLTIEYVDTEAESDRQKELADWLEENQLWYLGDYFVDVKADFWIECDKWKASTDIAAAWQVVEEMNKKGFVWSLYQLFPDEWKALIYDGAETRWQGASGKLPLAICRVALIVVVEE